MILMTGNWRIWLAGMAVSLAIFGVLLFTVIKPSSDTANRAVKSGLQQSEQALNQAQKQISTAGGQTSGVTKQAQKELSGAQRLTACIASAGTDVAHIQACQTKFGH